MLDFKKLSADYQQALLRQAVPFWLKSGRDELCGGYFDYLTSTGEVIEGDKFITLQAQQAWAFTWLYNKLDGQPTWLAHAQHGVTFLSQFAHDNQLDTYVQLDRRGRLVTLAPGSIPASYAIMAYVQFHLATGKDEWAMLAKQLFSTLIQHRKITLAEQEQAVVGVQQLRHLSEPVTLLKMLLELKPLLEEEVWKENIELILQELLHEFVDRRTNTLREYILPEGFFVNTPHGRRLNVGLTFQTSGYLLDLCLESGNRKLALQTTSWCLKMCEQAWDESTGGLNQYVDIKNQPLVFPEWAQKWAWVHLEAISALTKSYFQTRHPDCPKWIKRIHDYTFQHFPDHKQIGWHLVIGQNNQPLMDAKATESVGCFSLIKCLAETAQTLTKCGQLQPVGREIRVS